MIIDKLVIRFKDKTVLKGKSIDFSISKAIFHLRLLTGKVVQINMEKLKAVFLVKCFNGNKDYKYLYKDFLPWEGNKIKVRFTDGEEMIGYTPYHDNGQPGFFLTPADLNGNNNRVFVLASATREITFL